MAIPRNSVGDPTHKACFCDGSCKESGLCGVDMSDLVHRYPSHNIQGINPCLEIPKPTMAEKLKEKAKAAQQERKEAQKRKAQELYEELLPEFEKAAEYGSGKYLVLESLLKGCDLSTFNTLMAEEGFVTTQHDRGIYVSWDDEPLFNIRR